MAAAAATHPRSGDPASREVKKPEQRQAGAGGRSESGLSARGSGRRGQLLLRRRRPRGPRPDRRRRPSRRAAGSRMAPRALPNPPWSVDRGEGAGRPGVVLLRGFDRRRTEHESCRTAGGGGKRGTPAGSGRGNANPWPPDPAARRRGR
jgi:hypothetical protein